MLNTPQKISHAPVGQHQQRAGGVKGTTPTAFRKSSLGRDDRPGCLKAGSWKSESEESFFAPLYTAFKAEGVFNRPAPALATVPVPCLPHNSYAGYTLKELDEHFSELVAVFVDLQLDRAIGSGFAIYPSNFARTQGLEHLLDLEDTIHFAKALCREQTRDFRALEAALRRFDLAQDEISELLEEHKANSMDAFETLQFAEKLEHACFDTSEDARLAAARLVYEIAINQSNRGALDLNNEALLMAPSKETGYEASDEEDPWSEDDSESLSEVASTDSSTHRATLLFDSGITHFEAMVSVAEASDSDTASAIYEWIARVELATRDDCRRRARE